MGQPSRSTRRVIVYWAVVAVSAVIVWLMLPGDIHPIEQALAMVLVPSLVGIIVTYLGGEVYDGHSERRHGGTQESEK